jgi:hypothetical protein
MAVGKLLYAKAACQIVDGIEAVRMAARCLAHHQSISQSVDFAQRRGRQLGSNSWNVHGLEGVPIDLKRRARHIDREGSTLLQGTLEGITRESPFYRGPGASGPLHLEIAKHHLKLV